MIERVLDAPAIIDHQKLVRRVGVTPQVQDYAVRMVLSTHPEGQFATPEVNRYFRFGASPRAAQTIVLGGKVRALLDGRTSVAVQDIKEIALPALRHRCLLNFEAEAEGITTDEIIGKIMDTLPAEVELAASS